MGFIAKWQLHSQYRLCGLYLFVCSARFATFLQGLTALNISTIDDVYRLASFWRVVRGALCQCRA